ncbi:MAG: heme-binding beta-barrel domain-containing protein [Ghiorsea sp.]
MSEVNYGPLAALIGTWTGDKGTDIAPEPNASENTPYFETITFEAIGDVTNAGKQTLAVLLCTQIVKRQENGDTFHHQVGYWSWDASNGAITHSFTIPRGVSIVACGKVLDDDESDPNKPEIEVLAEEDGFYGGIVQSPFMKNNARTTAFEQKLTLDGGTLHYTQTMMLDIYQKTFEHTDTNTLTRQK